MLFLVVFVLGDSSGTTCIGVDGLDSSEAGMWDIVDQIVVIIAVRRIIPANEVLINVINIADKIRKRLSDEFDLWNVSKNVWIRTEINVLRLSLRLICTDEN
mmetsp:Transcript_25356/g.73020  ORF Transcript_25356/g.73020 Transcript_25356/m.73020 type:complete len:102 (-) Transcript_25356:1207-1512(-)